MEIFEITDDSGFLGLVNYDRYQSFIGENWHFETIKERIIEQINAHHLLFWATGMNNTWEVVFSDKASEKIAFREESAVIEVTNEKLYLTNYETLSMAADGYTKLPEKHLDDLYIDLKNGKYMIKFRQMTNPNSLRTTKEHADFEIVVQQMTRMPEIDKNKIDDIYWLNY